MYLNGVFMFFGMRGLKLNGDEGIILFWLRWGGSLVLRDVGIMGWWGGKLLGIWLSRG